MSSSPPLTALGRCVVFGVFALFAFCFFAEGLLIFQRGFFIYQHSSFGGRGYATRYSIGAPHARLIGAGCLAVGTVILLWGAVVVAPGLRSTPRRRAVVCLASALLLATAGLLWLPPWRLWPDSPLLLAYLLPAGLAFFWHVTRSNDVNVQELRRTRVVLALLGLGALLWYLFGVGIVIGAAVGLALIILAFVHLRFVATDKTPTRG